MGVADDLLRLAEGLAKLPAGFPEQICLRRSISTAYYALFHFLVEQAAQTRAGSQATQLGLERAFEHKRMREVAQAILHGNWSGWSAPSLPVPVELVAVARAFTQLQERRHQADYDNARSWTDAEVGRLIELVRDALQSWQLIRSTPVANEFLLSLLIGRKRE